MPLALAAPTHLNTVTTADDGWYRTVTSFAQHTAWLQPVMKTYTTAGIGLLVLMAIYAWWSTRGRARGRHASMAAVLWLGLGTIISVICGLALKQVFQENRPCQAIHTVTVEACPAPADYSFPSDHTIIAFALAVGLWLVNRKLGAIGLALAAIEGFSRIYLGQHYPHDVVAGVIVSGVILLAGWFLTRHPLTKLIALLEASPLRPLTTSASAGAPATDPADRRPADTANQTERR